MLVPLVAVIVFLAVYPQLALHRSEGSVKSAVARAQADSKQGFQTASLRTRHTPASAARERVGRRRTPQRASYEARTRP